MLSISSPRSASSAIGYYVHLKVGRNELGKEDYYAKEGDGGRWIGEAAASLGLSGAVEGKAFAALANGFSQDGDRLAQNAGDPERRAGYDLTFSAPKSVSIAWAVADQDLMQKIEAAQARAVAAGVAVMQEQAGYARTGKDGEQLEACKLLIAAFQHGTSRELDMQLHTHCFTFNQALRENGNWASLDSRQLYEWQKVGGAAYRAELAQGLRELGFQIERDGESFRIVGVPSALEKHFSTRREQILDAMRERGTYGAKAAEVAALDTRIAKAKELDPVQLKQEWQAISKEHGLSIAKVEELATGKEAPALAMPDASAILNKATEHEAVIREKDVILAAMVEAQGVGGAAKGFEMAADCFSQAVQIERQNGQIRYSTQELVRIETEIGALSSRLSENLQHQLPMQHINSAIQAYEERKTAELQANGVLEPGKNFVLRAEQREAIEHLVGKSGQVAVMVGDAGTGKTTTLEGLREVYGAKGFEVVGAALAGKAAGGLEAGSGIQSSTIDSALLRLENGSLKLHEKSILVIDEAGMVDSRKTHSLIRVCEAAGAKLVMVGDNKQLQPVAAGAPFRHVADRAGFCRLEDNARQKQDWHKEAVQQLSRGEAAKALNQYIEKGLVTVVNTHKDAVAVMARQYIFDRKEVGEKQAGMIVATNSHARDLNAAARDILIKEGGLTDSRQFETLGKDLNKNTISKQIDIGTGDRIVITNNDKATGLKNGDYATVLKLVKDMDGTTKLEIRVDRTDQALTVKAENLHIRHGYAATTHKWQGAELSNSGALITPNTYREMLYVQVSRARNVTNMVITNHTIKQLAKDTDIKLAPGKAASLEGLKSVVEAMSKSMPKESTLDYQKVEQAKQINKETEMQKVQQKVQTAIEKAKTPVQQEKQPLTAEAAAKIINENVNYQRHIKALEEQLENAKQPIIENQSPTLGDLHTHTETKHQHHHHQLGQDGHGLSGNQHEGYGLGD